MDENSKGSLTLESTSLKDIQSSQYQRETRMPLMGIKSIIDLYRQKSLAE
ncbi:protein of unknown function [Cyanobium sp. NIES-981]|nr:protein of unknown function [Cyanobium sp. NIES-981]